MGYRTYVARTRAEHSWHTAGGIFVCYNDEITSTTALLCPASFFGLQVIDK